MTGNSSEQTRAVVRLTKRWKADVTAALATTLTSADRCDRCGAQAYVRARLSTGGELLFCGHHGRAHLAKLQDVSTEIIDESDRLRAESASSI